MDVLEDSTSGKKVYKRSIACGLVWQPLNQQILAAFPNIYMFLKECDVDCCHIQGLQYGTVRWYSTFFFVMVRVRYVGTLFECAYQTFYVQHADVNEDLCDRTRCAHGLGYSQVLIIAS